MHSFCEVLAQCLLTAGRDTLNIDENLIEAAITAKTRAIAPVHYAGVGCEMDTISKIAQKHRLIVVEDAAQGVNAKYKGRYLGTIGDMGAYSFHETKNFICGEGGAIVLNRQELVERAEIIREKGTNRTRFFRGEVDKYTWVDIGSSFLPSDILAAFLYAQLENMDAITKKRQEIYRRYETRLRPLEDQGLIGLPTVPPECESNYHMFYIVLNSLDERTRLIEHLKAQSILAVFHYVPLHTSPMGLAMGYHLECCRLRKLSVNACFGCRCTTRCGKPKSTKLSTRCTNFLRSRRRRCNILPSLLN